MCKLHVNRRGSRRNSHAGHLVRHHIRVTQAPINPLWTVLVTCEYHGFTAAGEPAGPRTRAGDADRGPATTGLAPDHSPHTPHRRHPGRAGIGRRAESGRRPAPATSHCRTFPARFRASAISMVDGRIDHSNPRSPTDSTYDSKPLLSPDRTSTCRRRSNTSENGFRPISGRPAIPGWTAMVNRRRRHHNRRHNHHRGRPRTCRRRARTAGDPTCRHREPGRDRRDAAGRSCP